MARLKYIQHNFTSGEISKNAEGRVDFSKYYHSVKTMRNFLPTVLGGATRRPGFHFADYPKYNDKKCRLIPFEFGVTQAYIIEAGELYFRFWMDGYLIRELTGSDLITNGSFTTDLTGWTDYSVSPGSAVWNSGHVDLNGGTDGVGAVGQAINTVANKTYLLTFDVGTNPLKLRIGTTENGTEIVYDVQYAAGTTRQVAFIARGTTTYITFLKNSNGIATLDNVVCREYAPVEITSPYLEADLPLLKWAQDANNLYIVHPSYAPRVLTRSSNVSWTLETMQFEDGPYFNEVTSPTITPSWAGASIEKVTNGGFDTDTAWTKGSNWTISNGKANKSPGGLNSLSQDTGEAASEIYKVVYTINSISGGSLTVSIGGVSGTARSAPGTYTEFIVATGTGDLTFTPSDANVVCSIDNVSVYRMSELVASSSLWVPQHVGALWRINRSGTWGWCRIEHYIDGTHVYAYVGSNIGTAASTSHREGRWSDYRGWPRSITFHENRLIFGGATTSPQTFWGSKTEEFNNMTPGTTDSDAIQFTLGSNNVNLIQWITSAKSLLIGTAGGEFRASGGDAPITPTNIDVKNDTTYGCSSIQPLRIGGAVIFVQRVGRQLFEFLYNYDSDSYEARDLTILADHLTIKGIQEIVYQKGYNPIVWAYDGDGTLLALTYNKGQEIVAWSHHNSGIIESLAVIPNPSEREDEVYALIRRTINGIEKRCIEYLDSYLNVDCGLSSTFSSPVSIISGLEHLAGMTVNIVGDDAAYTPQTVNSNGQIFLDPPASAVEVGIGYISYLETLRPEVPSEQTTIQASKKRWTKIYARLVDTVGLKINGEEIPFRTSFDKMNKGITPFSGDKEVMNVGWEDNGKIIIEQDKPLPATILCIFGNLEVNED